MNNTYCQKYETQCTTLSPQVIKLEEYVLTLCFFLFFLSQGSLSTTPSSPSPSPLATGFPAVLYGNELVPTSYLSSSAPNLHHPLALTDSSSVPPDGSTSAPALDAPGPSAPLSTAAASACTEMVPTVSPTDSDVDDLSLRRRIYSGVSHVSVNIFIIFKIFGHLTIRHSCNATRGTFPISIQIGNMEMCSMFYFKIEHLCLFYVI